MHHSVCRLQTHTQDCLNRTADYKELGLTLLVLAEKGQIQILSNTQTSAKGGSDNISSMMTHTHRERDVEFPCFMGTFHRDDFLNYMRLKAAM